MKTRKQMGATCPLISELFNYLHFLEQGYSYTLSSAVTPISANSNRSTDYRIPSINFEDENFADSKWTVKTAKITYLENLYVYGRQLYISGRPNISFFHIGQSCFKETISKNLFWIDKDLSLEFQELMQEKCKILQEYS